MKIQKLAMVLIIFINALFLTNNVYAADEGSSGFVDDSIRDMSIVLGTGAAGAVLGLSTLSFVEEPSDHMRNVAVGGAIGIVIGVTVVIFSQASKSSLSQNANETHPINEFNYDSIKREEFKTAQVTKSLFRRPDINFSFEF